MLTWSMPRWPVMWLIAGLAACSGCGGSGAGQKSEPTATGACSDSAFAAAVLPRLRVLHRAVLKTDAGHGDVDALGAAAHGLVSAAALAREAATTARPCEPRLKAADALLLRTTRQFSEAGHQLTLLAAAAGKGKDYSDFQTTFLNDWFAASSDFQDALASLRGAGVPGLVSSTDGKGIFVESGCSTCHTLAAAAAHATVGPNLDRSTPTRAAVVVAVKFGVGPMAAFEGVLSAAQIKAVADFVSRNAGK
jgi:hypothetical protein